MRKQIVSGFAVMLTATLMLSVISCDKEPVDQKPQLPPVESLMMDFSDFDEQPAVSKGSVSTYQNFTRAYLSVGIVNLSLGVVSALPVAAYAHALQHEAEYMGDNNWEWSYNFMLNGVNYSAILTAHRISNEEFTVDMTIADGEQSVKWFDGVVRYDHTSADWTIYRDGSIPVLAIAWNKDFETEAADLTYTYIEPDQAESGSYVMWEYIPGADFDSEYTVSLAAGQTSIQWNTTSISGRIKEPAFFGDDAWHCWDSKANGFADMDCN